MNEVIIPGMGRCTVCGRPIGEGMLMCLWHWRRVPLALRRHVGASLAGFVRGTVPLRDLREAQEAARRAVTGEAA